MDPVDAVVPQIALAWGDEDLYAPEETDEEARFEASTDLRRWFLERSATLAREEQG